jgi:hypothetical protein
MSKPVRSDIRAAMVHGLNSLLRSLVDIWSELKSRIRGGWVAVWLVRAI